MIFFRLEFIVSYSKGHSMKTVVSGLQDGANILKFFGDSRRKKVFLYLSPGKDEIKLLNKVKYLSLIGAKNLKLRRFCVIYI